MTARSEVPPEAAFDAVVVSGPDLPAGARVLRHDVFVGEQGVAPALEVDGRDAGADHAVVAAADGSVLATGRLLDPGPPADAGTAEAGTPEARSGPAGVVGRVAVRADRRGQGLGLVVMRALERRAADRGLDRVELHAQLGAVGFYRRQGYAARGDVYLEAGIEHQTMVKELLPGLRPVHDRDGPALIRLIGAVWSEYPGCVLDVDGEEPWLRAPAAAYRDKGGAFWVLPEGAEILACGGLRPTGGPAVVELKSLYVAASARRRGLGAALVRRVERVARAGGGRRVELWSDTRFGDAHRLYTRLGYVRTGRERALLDLSATVEYEFARDLPASP